MWSAHELSVLIGAIYEGATAHGGWTRLAHDFSRFFAAPVAGISVRREVGTRKPIAHAGLDTNGARRAAYDSYFWDKDVMHGRLLTQPPGIPLGIDAANHRTVSRSEYYNDYMAPAGHRHIAMCRTAPDRGLYAKIYLGRLADQDPFSGSDLDMLAVLVPHLERAARIRNDVQLAQLVDRSAAGDALDRLTDGIVLVDHTRRIVFANALASAILREGDGLDGNGDRLGAGDPANDHEIDRLIAAADSAPAARAVGRMQVTRSGARRPLEVVVTAVSSEMQARAHGAVATFCLMDPERGSSPVIQSARTRFGLTGKETALAELLWGGQRLVEAARTLRLSHEAARFHLKNLFQKTGAHSQVEFVHLLTDKAGRS